MLADIGSADAMVWVAAISAIATVVVSIVNNRKLGDMHTQFNHRVDELVVAAELRGIAQEKDRRDASDQNTALIMADQEGRVLAWSPGATMVFGWSAADVMGKNLRDLIIPEEFQELHQKAMNAAAHANRPPRKEPLIFNAHDKSGQRFLVEASLSGIKTGDRWFYSARLKRRAERFDVAPPPDKV